MVWFWWFVLLLAVGAAHWGSDRLAEPLRKVRRQWGLSAAAGGSLVALATASPEVGTNAVSAIRGVTDIGIGNLLGANIVSVPAIVTTAYIAARTAPDCKRVLSERGTSFSLAVDKEANTVQAIPYLLVIALVALLTLPGPWRGLQPIDAWIVLLAYFLYFGHALLRSRTQIETVSWSLRETVVAVSGVLMLIAGAYFTVRATEHIVVAIGIADVIGGLFITATMSVLPEVFATWSLARSGQVTSATTTVIADNTVTMTLAFFPLALVTTAISDFRLYWVNLLFVAVLGIAYALFVRFGSKAQSFEFWEVVALNAIYAIYLGVMVFGVLGVH